LWIASSIVNSDRPERVCWHVFQCEDLWLSTLGKNARVDCTLRGETTPAHSRADVVIFQRHFAFLAEKSVRRHALFLTDPCVLSTHRQDFFHVPGLRRDIGSAIFLFQLQLILKRVNDSHISGIGHIDLRTYNNRGIATTYIFLSQAIGAGFHECHRVIVLISYQPGALITTVGLRHRNCRSFGQVDNCPRVKRVEVDPHDGAILWISALPQVHPHARAVGACRGSYLSEVVHENNFRLREPVVFVCDYRRLSFFGHWGRCATATDQCKCCRYEQRTKSPCKWFSVHCVILFLFRTGNQTRLLVRDWCSSPVRIVHLR